VIKPGRQHIGPGQRDVRDSAEDGHLRQRPPVETTEAIEEGPDGEKFDLTERKRGGTMPRGPRQAQCGPQRTARFGLADPAADTQDAR